LKYESAPKGAQESTTTSLIVAESALTFEDRHAAYLVGFGDGMNHRLRLDAEDRARALLATWANESRDMATRYAARVGPAWSALIAECGGLDD